jgi:hypothetical protein
MSTIRDGYEGYTKLLTEQLVKTATVRTCAVICHILNTRKFISRLSYLEMCHHRYAITLEHLILSALAVNIQIFSVWRHCFPRSSKVVCGIKHKVTLLFNPLKHNRTSLCREVRTPALYSEDLGFKSRPGDRLSWLSFIVALLSFSRKMPW